MDRGGVWGSDHVIDRCRWDAAGGRVTGWLDDASERFAERRRLVLGLAGAYVHASRDWMCVIVCVGGWGLMVASRRPVGHNIHPFEFRFPFA